MIVQKTGTGTTENPYRPDLPEGTSYTVIADLGDSFELADVVYPTIIGEIPQKITKTQGLIQLDTLGKYDDLLTIVQQSPRLVQIAYETSQNWDRQSQMIQDMASNLDIEGEELDQFFLNASKIILP